MYVKGLPALLSSIFLEEIFHKDREQVFRSFFLFCIIASILLLQLLGYIYSERALAQVTGSERQRKRTRPRFLYETVEVFFNSEVLSTAEILKATFCTLEALWALHSHHNLFYLFLMFVFHDVLLLCITFCISGCNEA